jgi:hypothetical protein
MTDVFISYSSSDKEVAQFMKRHMEQEQLNVFLARVSLEPGDRWEQRIQDALKNATWVLFLCSQAACSSQYVMQEMGGAIYAKKEIVPIVWDMSPTKLPGWLNQVQALDLRGVTAKQVQEKIVSIAKKIKAKKTDGQIIGSIALAALAFLVFKGE